jgi:hypothetical protein
VREMIGAGVPVFKPNVRNGRPPRQVPLRRVKAGDGATGRWHSNLDALHIPLPKVVESGHKMRQPRAGHPFPCPNPAATWLAGIAVHPAARAFAIAMQQRLPT